MKEVFKSINGQSPIFTKEIFSMNENLGSENVSAHPRAQFQFYNATNPRKVKRGLETLRHLGPKYGNRYQMCYFIINI